MSETNETATVIGHILLKAVTPHSYLRYALSHKFNDTLSTVNSICVWNRLDGGMSYCTQFSDDLNLATLNFSKNR